jgi:hypothetical protein
MATLGDVATKARSLTHTNIYTYTTANILIDINIWYQKIVSAIMESQDDSDFDDMRNTNYPIVTTPLVAGQRDYSMPVSETVLKIKRVDVTYDGINYYRATPFDDGVAGWGFGNATNEDANMIKQAPRYDVKFNSIFLYPLAAASDVSAGALMRVEWFRNVTPFSSSDYTTDPNDSTVIPGFDPVFHHMMSYGAAYEFANANNLPQLANIKQDLADWETRLRTAYGRKQLDEVLFLRPGYDNYGDNGASGVGGYSYGR